MASGQPFASRSYAGTKLPDRSVNTNAMPFSASSFSRHRGLGNANQGDFNGPEGQKQMQQSAPAPATNAQSHGPAQDANPLSRLTEEQREEINEAVRDTPIHLDTPVPPITVHSCNAASLSPSKEVENRKKPQHKSHFQTHQLTNFSKVHPLRPRPRPPPGLPRTPRRLPRSRLHTRQTRANLPLNNLRCTPTTSPATTSRGRQPARPGASAIKQRPGVEPATPV